MERKIHGCEVAYGALHVSHLIFVDDSYLVFIANIDECTFVKEILTVYKSVLGASQGRQLILKHILSC